MYKLVCTKLSIKGERGAIVYETYQNIVAKRPSLLNLLITQESYKRSYECTSIREAISYEVRMENINDLLEFNPSCTPDVHTYLIKTLAETSEEFLEAYLPINPKRFFE